MIAHCNHILEIHQLIIDNLTDGELFDLNEAVGKHYHSSMEIPPIYINNIRYNWKFNKGVYLGIKQK